jgi:glycine betaine/proline transport system ATP-binding protein
MGPLQPGTRLNGATVAAGITIEEAIRIAANAPETDYAVLGPDGHPLGVVNLRQLANAMVSAGRPVS